MANEPHTGSGKAYTPPKGRATASRDATSERSRIISPTLQWVMVAVVLAAIVAVAWFFSSPGSGGHGGLPADDPPAAAVTTADL